MQTIPGDELKSSEKLSKRVSLKELTGQLLNNRSVCRTLISLTIDVQPYVHQALLSIVITHAQISSTSPAILSRVMAALVESFAADLLSCFRKIPSFCMGGMLQATLEVEFLHQTLGSNVSKTAGDTLQAVYGTIEKAYVGAGGVDLELGKVKSLLQKSRASTKYVYACFKSSRKGTVREGSSSNGSRSQSMRSKGSL